MNGKDKFIERLDYHKSTIMMDIALLDKYKDLFSRYTKEIQMYICSAERAIEINAGKSSDILLLRTSHLRDVIQKCRDFIPDIDKQKESLANLVMQLQTIFHICTLSFSRLLLNPDTAKPIDDIIENLNIIIDSVKPYI